MKNKIISLLLILTAGFGAGAIGGLFGTGGGILIVFLFSHIYAKSTQYEKKDCFAMTVFVMALISCVSLFSYIRAGHVHVSELLPIALPTALGGIAGALLLDRIPLVLLRKLFAALILYAGITLLFR